MSEETKELGKATVSQEIKDAMNVLKAAAENGEIQVVGVAIPFAPHGVKGTVVTENMCYCDTLSAQGILLHLAKLLNINIAILPKQSNPLEGIFGG